MNAPVWLIAGREFRAYAATFSFWIALIVGPLFMAGALALVSFGGPSDVPFKVTAADPARAAALGRAVVEVGALEGHRLVVSPNAAAKVVLTGDGPGQAELRIDDAVPLSPSGRMLVLRTLEWDAVRAGGAAPPTSAGLRLAKPAPAHAPDLQAASRFAIAMMLWLTLTGSLGMLLQAVVRERANRALETLLAAARPWEIVVGKLTGVGLVSIVVLAAWLGSAAAVAAFSHSAAGQVAATLRAMGDPLMLLRAGAIYLAAFAFYGLVTVAVGARARDTASAQNLSRPMFATLLVAFFATLASAGGAAGHLAWLVYLPPFTPFMLLTQSYSAVTQVVALGLLATAAVLAGRAAIGGLYLTFGSASAKQKTATV